ncbi:MAG TPA: VOC family protein [Allosphingosinicella sp.]|nr:VOC family protein [Allosphingosinicella sp.]
MQQQIAVITLGVAELARSRRFYVEGFGWAPVFGNEEILFYQMNGFVLGTWLRDALAKDAGLAAPGASGGFALAHNVRDEAEVAPAMARLLAAGGTLLRAADAPGHGGCRGYVADPDGHAWEIAWNPAWPIDDQGHVRFAAA